MRFLAAAVLAGLAFPASAGDIGTTVTWSCESEITGKTGEKQYG